MGCKESNQTKTSNNSRTNSVVVKRVDCICIYQEKERQRLADLEEEQRRQEEWEEEERRRQEQLAREMEEELKVRTGV